MSYILDTARTPIGLKNGNMVGLRPDDLASDTIKAILDRNSSIPKENIEDIVVGCAFPEGPQGMLIGRSVSILSGLPPEVPGKVVNRFCGSSMDAVHQVSQAIDSNDIDLAFASGVEDMFSVPMGGFNPSFHPELYEQEYYIGMGETAENLARELSISRQDQEDFAINSHKKALNSFDKGYFENEIIPILGINGDSLNRDEGPREPDLEKIKSLSPAFDADGTITAATSSPVSIGASSMLLASKNYISKHDLKPRAKIISRSISGVDWKVMGKGPLPSTEKALSKAGMSMSDIDAIELNEAFAAQSLYVIRKGGWDIDKINLFGGAIALGHPLGCSGSRILGTLLNVLERKNLNVGLATMCIGTGQGIATIIERI